MDKKSVWKEIQKIKDPVVRAYLENAVQEQTENTTLKKALTNAINNHCPCKGDAAKCKYPKLDCTDCFIQQAQQQLTHGAYEVTHGEAEKMLLHYRRVAENADEQITTLKKALEMAANRLPGERCKVKCPDDEDCVKCYIHQAQQLMHETHGSESDMRQTQYGKDDSHETD